MCFTFTASPISPNCSAFGYLANKRHPSFIQKGRVITRPFLHIRNVFQGCLYQPSYSFDTGESVYCQNEPVCPLKILYHAGIISIMIVVIFCEERVLWRTNFQFTKNSTPGWYSGFHVLHHRLYQRGFGHPAGRDSGRHPLHPQPTI